MARLGGVALLRKSVTVGVGLEVYAQALSSVAHGLLLLPVDQDVAVSAPPVPCLPVILHILCHDGDGLNLSQCKPATIKCFPL